MIRNGRDKTLLKNHFLCSWPVQLFILFAPHSFQGDILFMVIGYYYEMAP